MRIRVLAFLFLCWVGAQAQISAQFLLRDPKLRVPIQNYLLLSGQAGDERAARIPKMDDVLITKLDINGDGQKELFISSRNFGDRSGLIWQAYQPGNGGYELIKAQDIIQFRTDAVHAGSVPELNFRGLLAFFPGPNNTGELYGYTLKQGELKGEHLRDVDLNESTDAELVKKYLSVDAAEKTRVDVQRFSFDELRSLDFRLPQQ